MTNAGWYPDPAGAPNTYRYWDGQSWSQQTSTDPFGTAASTPSAPAAQPGPPPPPPQSAPPGQGQPPLPTYASVPPPPQPPSTPYGVLPQPQQPRRQWDPMPTGPSAGSGSGAGRTVAIVLGTVAFLVLLAILAFVGVKVLGGGDDTGTVGAAGPARTRSSTPGTDPSAGGPTALGTVTPTTQQCAGGLPSASFLRVGKRISAGGLSALSQKEAGFVADPAMARAFTFAGDVEVTSKLVAANWASTIAVASVSRQGFSSPENAARSLMVCVAENPSMYQDATALDEVSAQPVTVSGRRGFSITENIEVDVPGLRFDGDTVQIVVLDTGDSRSYGVFLMTVPIDDQPLLALQKKSFAALRAK